MPSEILTRSDLIAAHRRRLDETHVAEQSLSWRWQRKPDAKKATAPEPP